MSPGEPPSGSRDDAPRVTRYLSATDIAEKLGLDPPTAEQIAVIEAPLSPTLVVAGAGSGKTETMANRIVWLVANDYVQINQVLGLTFTRKAASELAERVHNRVAQLRTMQRATSGAEAIVDILDAPTISTYNAFASGLFREYATVIGRESDQTVITDASAWRLVRAVVIGSDDPRLSQSDRTVESIVTAVIDVARALSDNDRWEDLDAIRRFSSEFVERETMPLHDGTSRKRSPSKNLGAACRDVGQLPLLLDLASTFRDEKRRNGFVEFSDQVALALEICRRAPRVVEELRARYRVVILDEYQDTSAVQTDLLAALFAEHPVMAVGDPNQSIYGWRGASAGNLAHFSRDFSGSTPCAKFTLSTSWRNSSRVLEAANVLVSPLPQNSSVPVAHLRASPTAPKGDVSVSFTETIVDEAAALARWFLHELARPSHRGTQRSAALLCRSLKNVSVFTDALAEHGVPFFVVGVEALLDQPVIVDLVCALKVVNDPASNSELVRVLTGARWRIGTKDIKALNTLARWLASHDQSGLAVSDETRHVLRQSTARDEGYSLVDALDYLQNAPDDHRLLADISAEGRERMRVVARQFTAIRRRPGLNLHDLVHVVVQELQLDIEVAANERNRLGQASLEAFSEQVSGFLGVDERGTLGEFVNWLDEAERRERWSPRSEDPVPGSVQVLTIHGSKGLEWDSVAVPRVVAGELPSDLRSKRGWTSFGNLPYEFRGDALELPDLAWRATTTQVEFDEAYATFGHALAAQHDAEQRRLAYVAVTRARDSLLVSGSFWSTQIKPRPPGVFAREVATDVLNAVELPEAPEDLTNPLIAEDTTIEWPLDPLGVRATAVYAAAEAVHAADPLLPTRWSRDIELLLAERALRSAADTTIVPPTRLAASRFKDFVSKPEELARQLRRPLPERPFRQARLGTLFHSWVEKRSGMVGGFEQLDGDSHEQDSQQNGTLRPLEIEELESLEALQRTFELSEWADLQPVDVERELNVVLGSQVIVCKIDAVYLRDGRYQIVDWKTGRAPRTEAERAERQFQLSLYRTAYARWKKIDPSEIDAVFFYVADNIVERPMTLHTEGDLVELLQAVAT